MIGRAYYLKWQEDRRDKKAKELEEARLEGARQKHEEWVRWTDNGRDEASRPKPPEVPKPPNSVSST